MRVIGAIFGFAVVVLPPLAVIAMGATAIAVTFRGIFTNKEDQKK